MKEVINDALRRGLRSPPRSGQYRPPTHHSAVRPGLDLAGLNRLTDELADGQQLASYALERHGTVYSTDTDFGRFPKVSWTNPLQ